MRNIALIDESFDSNVTSAYNLAIQFSDKFLSVTVLDTLRNQFIAFKNYWFADPVPESHQGNHLQNLFQSEKFLKLQYRSVNFMYISPVSVLVPDPLFRKENPAIYFKYSAQLKNTDKIIYRKISSIDAFVVFTMPEDLINQIDNLLPHAQFFHQSCTQIETAMTESILPKGLTRVFTNVNNGFIDILVIRSEQVLLYNSFVAKNTNDLVFFILYMYEQFGLPQEEVPVILSGFIELYPGAAELLNQYIKQIILRDLPKGYAYSHTFGDIEQHHYSQLMNLARCE